MGVAAGGEWAAAVVGLALLVEGGASSKIRSGMGWCLKFAALSCWAAWMAERTGEEGRLPMEGEVWPRLGQAEGWAVEEDDFTNNTP